MARWAKNAETEARYWAGRQRVSVSCALCRKQLAEGVSLGRSHETLDRDPCGPAAGRRTDPTRPRVHELRVNGVPGAAEAEQVTSA
jgi:hypothetical protein